MEIKSVNNKKWNIENISFDIFSIFILSEMVINILKVGMEQYQIFKDIYFFISSSLLLILIIGYRKINPFRLVFLIPFLAYSGAIARELTKNEYGEDYCKWIICKYLMLGLFLLIIIDMVFSSKKEDRKFNYVFCLITALVFAFSWVLKYDTVTALLCPFFAFYLTEIGKDEWKRLMGCFSISLCIGSYYLLIKSLLEEPFTVINGYRYVGNFFFPSAAAMTGVCGIFGLTGAFFAFRGIVDNKKKLAIITSVLALCPLALLVVSAHRTSLLALGVTFIIMFCCFVKLEKRKTALLFGGIAGLVALGLSLYIIGAIQLKDYLPYEIENFKVPFLIKKIMMFIKNTSDYFINQESIFGSFPNGSFMNFLDRVSSGRLSLWKAGYHKINLWGNDDTGVVLPDGRYLGHVHNTYLFWILNYGLICGLMLCGWFLWTACLLVKKAKNGNKEFFFPAAWGVFCVVYFVTEKVSWNMAAGFLLLFLIYPLLRKEEYGEKADE